MTTHHTSLYDDETNPAPTTVLKQELFTTEQTEYGVRVTKLKRQFTVLLCLKIFWFQSVVGL